jgi:hypothetical protein
MILTTIAVLLYVVSCYGFSKQSTNLIQEEIRNNAELQNVPGWVWTTLVPVMSLFWPVVLFVINVHTAFKREK